MVDCAAGGRQRGTLGRDPGRIGVLGTSAGACLAACTALRVRDAGGPALATQALIEPVLDDRATTSSMIDGVDAVFWNSRNAHARPHRCAGSAGDHAACQGRMLEGV